MRNSFTKIFQIVGLPALIIKPEGRFFNIEAANNLYLETTGLRESELIGRAISEIVSLKEEYRKAVQDSLQNIPVSAGKDIKQRKTQLSEHFSFKTSDKFWRFDNKPIFSEEGELEYILHNLVDITAEVLLEEAKQQNVQFIENNPDGFYSLNREGNFITANQGLATIAEVSLEQMMKSSFLPFCSPKDREVVQDHFEKVLTGKPQVFEAEFISAKGNRRILHISLFPSIRLGEIIGAYGIAKDSTLIRKSQKVILEKGTFLKANATFISALLEHELEEEALEQTFEVVGKAIDVDRMFYFGEYIHPETGESLIRQRVRWTRDASNVRQLPPVYDIPLNNLKAIASILEKNTPFIAVESQLPDGNLKDIMLDLEVKSMVIVPLFVNNNLRGFVGFDDCTRDRTWSEDEFTFLITLASNLSTALEKRVTKAAILEQQNALFVANQRFEMVMKATNEVIWDWDIHSDFVERADSFTQTFGYNTQETASMERFWLTRIAEPDRQRVQDSLRSALEDKTRHSWKEEYQFYKANGEISYINDRGVILRDKCGKALRMVGSVVDVTESHRMLNEIQRQNAILKEVSWQQSHVVRAPLARLKGLLELFELESFEDLDREEIWRLIHSSADELDEIVRKIVVQTEELEYNTYS